MVLMKPFSSDRRLDAVAPVVLISLVVPNGRSIQEDPPFPSCQGRIPPGLCDSSRFLATSDFFHGARVYRSPSQLRFPPLPAFFLSVICLGFRLSFP